MSDGKWVSKANLQTFWQSIRSRLAPIITEEIINVLPTAVGDNVTAWLTEHVDPVGSAVVVDDTLTIVGAAADAKKTGDEISGLKEDLSESVGDLKSALTGLYEKSTGLNMINPANISNTLRCAGSTNTLTGASATLGSTGFIKVKPNTTYVYSGTSSSLLGIYFAEDAEWAYGEEGLSKVVWEQLSTTTGRFTTPANAYYVVLNINMVGGAVAGTLQLEEGFYPSQIVAYEETNKILKQYPLDDVASHIRITDDGQGQGGNIVSGYEKNAVANDLHGCVIAGGGAPKFSNKIGAYTNHIWDGTSPVSDKLENDTMMYGTGAHLSVIGGGYDNVANGLASVLTGYHCLIDENSTHGTISGGAKQEIRTADYATISGGTQNKISSGYGTISGGKQNLIDSTSEGATIGGGLANQAKPYSFVGGGQNNKCLNSLSVITGGNNNRVTGLISGVLGGQNNDCNGTNSFIYGRDCKTNAANTRAYGRDSLADVFGQMAWANEKIANQGDRQYSEYLVRCSTTDESTAAYLSPDGANRIMLSGGEAWVYNIMVLAVGNTVKQAWTAEGAVYKDSSGFYDIGSPRISGYGDTGATFTISHGTSAILFTCKGIANETVQWFGKLSVSRLII